MAEKYERGDITPEDLALSDFRYFCKYPLNINLWECHKKWADAIQAVIESSEYEGLLLIAPADHGKTSSVMIPAMLWCHARNQDTRAIFASNKDEFAEQAGRAWARRIEKQKVMKEKFQLMKGDKWTDAEYTLARPNWESKDPSLLCLGVGSEIQSQRADIIFCDDIATRKNSANVGGREKIQSWFFTDLSSRLDKGGKMIVASHRVHPEDIYSQLKNKDNWLIVEDRAIISDENQTILAPENFTYKKLDEKRRDDPLGFALFYQQMPISQGLYVTRGQVEAARDNKLTFHNSMPEHLRGQFWKVVMSVDPAFSTSKWAKNTVITVWGLDAEKKKKTLLYGLRDRTSPEHLIEICKAKFRIYRPDKFFIESNTGQALLIPIMDKEFPNDKDRIVGMATTGPEGRLDDEIGGMLKNFHSQPSNIILPYGDLAAQSFVDFFTEEIINYPNYKYSDCIMSWYLMEKGMGLLEHEKRSAYIAPHGIINSVGTAIRRRHTLGSSMF